MPDNRSKLLGRGLPGKIGFELADLVDGDTIEWDTPTDKWIIGAPSAGVSQLDELSDVTLTALGDLEFLQFDNASSQWINRTANEAGLLTVVNVTSPVDDDIMAFNSTSGDWENRTIGQLGLLTAVALDDLSDVTLTSPATGGVLYKSAGDWLDTGAIVIDPAAGVILNWNGLNKFSTQTFGSRLRGDSANDPTTATTQSTQFLYDNLNGVEVGRIGWPSSTHLFIQNKVHEGHIILQAENSAGASTNLFVGDPDDNVELFHANIRRLATTTTGVDILGTELELDNSSDPNAAIIRARNNEGGFALIADTDTFAIRQTSSTGALENHWLQANNNGEVSLYYNGILRIQAGSTGIARIRSDGNTDTEQRVLVFEHANATDRALVGFTTDGVFRLRNIVTSGDIELEARDAGVANVTVLRGSPDGPVGLFHSGDERFQTQTTGIGIRGSLNNDPATSGAQDTKIQWLNSGGIQNMRMGFLGGTDFFIINETHGGRIILQAEDLSGVDQEILKGDPDGSVQLDYAGAIRFETTSDGADISNAATANTVFDVIGSGLNIDSTVGVRGDGGGARIKWDESATRAQFVETNAGGTETAVWIECDVGARVGLRHNNTEMMRTAIAANGGLEVNNTVTGGGFERVLTTSDITGGAGTLGALSDVSLTSPDTGGVLYKSSGNWLDTDALFIDPVAAVELKNNGTTRFRTLSTGAEVLGASFDLNNTGSSATANLRGRNDDGGMRIRIDGGQSAFFLTDNAGADVSQMANYLPNAGVQLYHNDTQKFITTADGVDISNSLAANTIFDVIGSGTNQDGVLGVRGDSGGARFYWDESATRTLVGQTTAGGTIQKHWIFMDVDAGVSLLHNDTSMLRTAVIASGGVEVNNTVTGGGMERVLTVSDKPEYKVKTVTQTLDDDVEDPGDLHYGNVLTDDDDLVGWTLDAASFYLVRGTLWMEVEADTRDAQIILTASQTPVVSLWGFKMSGDIVGCSTWDCQFNRAITNSMDIDWNGASEENVRSEIVLEGYIETHATLSTTINLQWAQRTSGSQLLTFYRGSWLSFEKMA